MSSSEEHSYTCFAKVGCRAPRKYSPDNGPSVQNGLDVEMVDHLDTKGSSPSTHFSHVMIEAKHLSTLARSSTPARGPPRVPPSLCPCRQRSSQCFQKRPQVVQRPPSEGVSSNPPLGASRSSTPSIPCYKRAGYRRSRRTATRFTIGLHLAEVKHLCTTKVPTIYKRALSLAQGLSVSTIYKRALSLAQEISILTIYKRALSFAHELSVPTIYKRAISLAQGLLVLTIYKRAFSLVQGLSIPTIYKRALDLAQGLSVLTIYKRALSLAQGLSVLTINKRALSPSPPGLQS
ncbi:hypothetical protein BHM03_00008993 [Ensete ventricosum]|nr:hypothetical protein BHM03_00008993 [Ensete ventricosum]